MTEPLTQGQWFGLVRIATGGECIVSTPTWEWLVEHGAVSYVDGVPQPNRKRAWELIYEQYQPVDEGVIAVS